jgi:hypothetical protein
VKDEFNQLEGIQLFDVNEKSVLVAGRQSSDPKKIVEIFKRPDEAIVGIKTDYSDGYHTNFRFIFA